MHGGLVTLPQAWVKPAAGASNIHAAAGRVPVLQWRANRGAGRVAMTQIAGVNASATQVAIDRDARINIGAPPTPRHLYTIPPRARPLVRAALEIRRRTPRTAAGMACSRTASAPRPASRPSFADAGLAVPALDHPHTGDDWHTAARGWHLHTPALTAPDVLPCLGPVRP